jgi:hypothetical protein
MSLYIVELRVSLCFVKMYNMYISPAQCDLGWNRCSKGTPIIKKPNPSLLSKEEQRKKKQKQKSWHRTNIWPWVPAWLDAKSDHAGWLPAVSYCSALLCSMGSRSRRRKGKSRIWDSKIWSRVPRDSDPRKTALTRASSIYETQTCPLVREGTPTERVP